MSLGIRNSSSQKPPHGREFGGRCSKASIKSLLFCPSPPPANSCPSSPQNPQRWLKTVKIHLGCCSCNCADDLAATDSNPFSCLRPTTLAICSSISYSSTGRIKRTSTRTWRMLELRCACIIGKPPSAGIAEGGVCSKASTVHRPSSRLECIHACDSFPLTAARTASGFGTQL